jgi:DNA polymerase-3 subunit alpha
MRLLVKEGWRNRETGKTGDPRISFLSFQQLQDTLEKNSKKLTLQLSIDDLSEEKSKEIIGLFKKFKGKNQLEFSFYENNEKIKLTMLSENYKISINEALISKIKEKRLHFKLS